ncbi:MAG TPA: family 1 encapsulin nanocompartment shell protein [Blastocatellia bacterium]|nr:family 1 encapsulin nanocompartment shell protein [Blastocatellia bacterium]
MGQFLHTSNPLTADEWAALMKVVAAVGNSTVTRKFIETTGPLGAGEQTVPTETLVGITEGYKSVLGENGPRVRPGKRDSGIVPIISKDFVIHWRDLAEARLMEQPLSLAKAAAAASSCARSEDKFVFFGHSPLGYEGLMTIPGRNIIGGLKWGAPGDAFENFKRITQVLLEKGHNGPFAAVVHPLIYADMHRVLKGSSLLEITHVRALLSAGIFRSSLLAPRSGLVVSTGKQNMELVISVDTSVGFLGYRRMNLPFRVFKAVYLRILRRTSICTF